MGGVVMWPQSDFVPMRSCARCPERIPANRYACDPDWDILPADVKQGIADTRTEPPHHPLRVIAEKAAMEYWTWGRPKQ